MESDRTDDELLQLLPSDLNIGAIATAVGGQLPKAITIHEHGKKIYSLEKEIEKKDDEIFALKRALQACQEQNDELKSALDTKDEEIDVLKSRINKLEDERTVVGGPLVGERNTPTAITIRERGERIDSLEKETKKKDDEIAALQKALWALQEQNNELKSALATKDKEIGALELRMDELEDEKTELQRELASVKTDLGLVQKEVDKLRKAKSSQEQANLNLEQDLEGFRRTLDTVKEDREKKRKESEELKEEVRKIKEWQFKGLLPLMRGARALPPGIPETSGEALLHLGEMCRQLQTKLYRFVFPSSVKDVNYKVHAIHRHLSKFPNPNAQRKWESIQERFHWDETHEEAVFLLQDTRNIEAHPEISKDSLQRAISITAQSNNLEDNWLLTKLLHELLEIWETDLSQ